MSPNNQPTPSANIDDVHQDPESDGRRVWDRAEAHMWQIQQMHLCAFEVQE